MPDRSRNPEVRRSRPHMWADRTNRYLNLAAIALLVVSLVIGGRGTNTQRTVIGTVVALVALTLLATAQVRHNRRGHQTEDHDA